MSRSTGQYQAPEDLKKKIFKRSLLRMRPKCRKFHTDNKLVKNYMQEILKEIYSKKGNSI